MFKFMLMIFKQYSLHINIFPTEDYRPGITLNAILPVRNLLSQKPMALIIMQIP